MMPFFNCNSSSLLTASSADATVLWAMKRVMMLARDALYLMLIFFTAITFLYCGYVMRIFKKKSKNPR
jgi:hypothetical protein